MTSWTPRTLDVDLSKLGIAAGATVELFCDGKQADDDATSYVHNTFALPESRTLSIDMAPGGGFMILLP